MGALALVKSKVIERRRGARADWRDERDGGVEGCCAEPTGARAERVGCCAARRFVASGGSAVCFSTFRGCIDDLSGAICERVAQSPSRRAASRIERPGAKGCRARREHLAGGATARRTCAPARVGGGPLGASQGGARCGSAGALALANQHRARFPNGMLEQEAEVIAVEALARAGRYDLAADRLVKFRARFANSAYLPHLETVVRRPMK